ncbi:hypothetical protein B0A50_06948 [Salinomyces thailandicus]|uniref:Uncharacterized protein n=1 Tax=Salinomyces thailandicus TaxID=706561 RepID=A0A4U0TPZ2_9PEZI|nr:hypothetical protein B0A50_06948 [Salinomyces thailandica]
MAAPDDPPCYAELMAETIEDQLPPYTPHSEDAADQNATDMHRGRPFLVSVLHAKEVKYKKESDTLVFGKKHDIHHFAVLLPPSVRYASLRKTLSLGACRISDVDHNEATCEISLVLGDIHVKVENDESCGAAMALSDLEVATELSVLVMQDPKGYDSQRTSCRLRRAHPWEMVCCVQ